MKLPENLPELESPFYILDVPALIQWPLLAIMVCSPLPVFIWIYAKYVSGGLAFYHWFIAVIVLVMLSALFNRNLWRRWVAFAADRRGVYFARDRSFDYPFTFVPWGEVGESSIGYTGLGYTTGQKTVILELSVSDELWNRIIYPRSGSFQNSSKIGVRLLGIGNSCRNVKRTQQNIERIRRIAAEERKGSGSVTFSPKQL
jgi:hypothetical protein